MLVLKSQALVSPAAVALLTAMLLTRHYGDVLPRPRRCVVGLIPVARKLRDAPARDEESRLELATQLVKQAYSECPNLDFLIKAILTCPLYRYLVDGARYPVDGVLNPVDGVVYPADGILYPIDGVLYPIDDGTMECTALLVSRILLMVPCTVFIVSCT